MNNIQTKISAFALDRKNQIDALALMKVGWDIGDDAELIMSRVIAVILLNFHGLPVVPPGRN